MASDGSILRRLLGRTARDILTVFAGHSVRSVLSFISNLVVIRILGPLGFGTVASASAVMTLSAQAVDFGLTTSSVRYGSRYLESDPGKSALVMKVTLVLKLLLGIPALVLLVLLSPRVASGVFGRPELTFALTIAFAGAFAYLLESFPLGLLQTYRMFGRYVFVAVSQGAAQLLFVALLFASGALEPIPVIAAFAAAPLVAFLLGMALSPRGYLRARGDVRGTVREILGFGKWIMISTFATMFIMRLDILMLTSMAGPAEVGKYAGASQLAMLFPLITGALTTALLPKATGIREREQLRRYVKDTFRITPFAVIVALPLLFFARPVVGFVFGEKYMDAVPIFTVLLLGFLLSVLLNPASLVFYSLERADLLAWLNLVQLGINFAGNLVLIPQLGGLGAALSSLAVRVFGSVYILYFLWRFLFSREGSSR
jgi:O-antigen/teichoic acid export membrane protein